jgi:hypothetical protein
MGNDFNEDHRGTPPESWAVPFRKAFILRGRPNSKLKWYLIWARRFAAYLSGGSLHLASRKDAEGYLSTLSSSPGIGAWQVEQATDCPDHTPRKRIRSRVGQDDPDSGPSAAP